MIAASQNARESMRPFDRISWLATWPGCALSETKLRQARLRRVFGLDWRAALPKLERQALLRYHRYLSTQLSFPFDARYFDEHEGAVCDNRITVARLVDVDECLRDPRAGIQCEVLACGHPVWIRLDELRLGDRSPAQEAIDDYRAWFHAQR
jgi:hypothetical protein